MRKGDKVFYAREVELEGGKKDTDYDLAFVTEVSKDDDGKEVYNLVAFSEGIPYAATAVYKGSEVGQVTEYF